MNELLDKVGFKKKTHIGISISSNNFIELVCVNSRTKSVEKYVSGNVKYNNAIREIIDYDELKEVLEGLFDEAGLDPSQCSVTLNLPNVHFGITAIDSESETPFIIENLQSEIEDLYIFKRNEPIISYSKIASNKTGGQKKVAYGAIQSKAVAKFIEIFDNLNCELERIDSSYSSLLRSIQFCDRFSKYVEKEERTTILLITPNSCSTFYLEGNILIDYYEEPLAVKSFSPEEVNSAISKIASSSISQHNPQTLLIISETDEVDAETLSELLDFAGEIDFINKSINSDERFIEISDFSSDVDTNMITYLTLEAVGAAVAEYDEYPLNINFLPPERIKAAKLEVFGYEVEMVRLIIVFLSLAIILGLIFGMTINLIMNSLSNSVADNSAKIKQKKEKYEQRLKRNEKNRNASIFPVLKQIVDNNTAIVNVYNALSTETPESIYIKKLKTNYEGGIGIVGEAKSSESVNTFVKGLREKNGDLTLSKLSINTEYDTTINRIPNGYTFEIKTASHDIYMEDDAGDVQNTSATSANVVPATSNVQPAVAPIPTNSGSSMTPPPPVI